VAEKIVVCCRMLGRGARDYLPRARVLTQRAEALGASLVSWSALTFAFAFEPDATEEVIDFATHLAHDAGETAGAQKWACGIGQGDLEPFAPTGARSELAWGEPLVVAVTLSRIARGGEVLLHASVKAALHGLLNTLDGFGDYESAIQVTFSEDFDMASASGNVALFEVKNGSIQSTPVPVVMQKATMLRQSALALSASLAWP